MDRLTRQLHFIEEAGRLRAVLRHTELTDPPRQKESTTDGGPSGAAAGSWRPENSAEHSWHLAVMALALADHAPEGTNIATVMTMLILHDLVEVDAGDLSVHAPAAAQERQHVAEQAAADRLYGLLPEEQGVALRRLWDEFEERATPEARFARALDRLQPILQDVRAGGRAWNAQGVTADQVLEKVELVEDGSPSLGELARRLVEQAVADGILATRPANQC